MLYAFNENFVLPFSHDEVVHGKRSMMDKMPGDAWQKAATLRALYVFMYDAPRQEAAVHGLRVRPVDANGRHDASLEWHLTNEPLHGGLQRFVADLNHIYRAEPALYEVDFEGGGFSWIDCNDWDSSVISFIRRARDPQDFVVVALNWTPVVRFSYRIGVPEPGYYRELMNSDAGLYGGGNVGNEGGVASEPIPAHGHAQSLVLTLPPLGGLLLKPVRTSPSATPIPLPTPA